MTMLRSLREVDAGLVDCPLRGGRVSLEQCGDCQWLVDVTFRDGAATLRCAPPVPVRLGRELGREQRARS